MAAWTRVMQEDDATSVDRKFKRLFFIFSHSIERSHLIPKWMKRSIGLDHSTQGTPTHMSFGGINYYYSAYSHAKSERKLRESFDILYAYNWSKIGTTSNNFSLVHNTLCG